MSYSAATRIEELLGYGTNLIWNTAGTRNPSGSERPISSGTENSRPATAPPIAGARGPRGTNQSSAAPTTGTARWKPSIGAVNSSHEDSPRHTIGAVMAP